MLLIYSVRKSLVIGLSVAWVGKYFSYLNKDTHVLKTAINEKRDAIRQRNRL